MNESKIALTERLRREGRWNAASKFKDDALRAVVEKTSTNSTTEPTPTIQGVELLFIPDDTTSVTVAEVPNDHGNIQCAKRTDTVVEIAPTSGPTLRPTAEPTSVTTSQPTSQPAAPPTTTPQAGTTGQETNAGDVTISEAAATADGPAVANLPREETQAEATRRWRNTGIAEQVAVFRDRIREEYRAANPKAKRRDAHEYAWQCAMAEFPPPGVEPQAVEPLPSPPQPEAKEQPDEPPAPPVQVVVVADQGVSGLGDLPLDWPTLPANASLPVEISWVNANRLRVRDGNGVDLSRALSPAPSYAALSWLETSILFPAKFADISVKATQNQEDEAQHVRRERMAIDEIRALLAEMDE